MEIVVSRKKSRFDMYANLPDGFFPDLRCIQSENTVWSDTSNKNDVKYLMRTEVFRFANKAAEKRNGVELINAESSGKKKSTMFQFE